MMIKTHTKINMECAKPSYFEAQKDRLCVMHAINNLLQIDIMSCEEMTRITKEYERMNREAEKEKKKGKKGKKGKVKKIQYMNRTGKQPAVVYDMIHTILDEVLGYECYIIESKDFKDLSRKQSPRLIGYIFRVTIDRVFPNGKKARGSHCVVLRKTQVKGCYYYIDSENPDGPVLVKTRLTKFLEKLDQEVVKVHECVRVVEPESVWPMDNGPRLTEQALNYAASLLPK